MVLFEKLSAENDAFHERMDSYESLPEEERIEKYRIEVKEMEAKVLEIVDGKYDGSLYQFSRSEDDMKCVWWWLMSRGYALEKMFTIHCSEAEHRPVEMSKGEFIWKRVVEYFEFDERDEEERRMVKQIGCHPFLTAARMTP